MADLTASSGGRVAPTRSPLLLPHTGTRDSRGRVCRTWGPRAQGPKANCIPRYLGTLKLLILSPSVKSAGGNQSFRSSSTLTRLTVMLGFSRNADCCYASLV